MPMSILSITRAAVNVACVMAVACGGGGTPTAPAPVPAPAAPSGMTLSGTVTEAFPTETTPVAGARVVIDDGTNAGKSTTADASGRYSLSGLQASQFNLHAGATGYEDRNGTIVFAADRVLNFQLFPELRTVSDSISSAIEPCNGDTYITCFSYPVSLHHRGPVNITLTTGGNSSMEVMFVQADSNYAPFSSTRRSGRTETFSFCGNCTTGKYEFRIVGRILERISLTAVITHPS